MQTCAFMFMQAFAHISLCLTVPSLWRSAETYWRANNRVVHRADSIVADAELVREALIDTADAQNSRWSLLGQSFGGFCAVQYLSAAPQGQQDALRLAATAITDEACLASLL